MCAQQSIGHKLAFANKRQSVKEDSLAKKWCRLLFSITEIKHPSGLKPAKTRFLKDGHLALWLHVA